MEKEGENVKELIETVNRLSADELELRFNELNNYEERQGHELEYSLLMSKRIVNSRKK